MLNPVRRHAARRDAASGRVSRASYQPSVNAEIKSTVLYKLHLGLFTPLFGRSITEKTVELSPVAILF